VTRGFISECFPNQFANTPDKGQIQIPVGLAGRAYANEGQFRLTDGFILVVGCPKMAGFDSRGDDFRDIGLDDRGLARVDQLDFGADRVHADDFVTISGKATRGNGSDVSQTKDADFQWIFLSRQN
jgi:hypothetical protein